MLEGISLIFEIWIVWGTYSKPSRPFTNDEVHRVDKLRKLAGPGPIFSVLIFEWNRTIQSFVGSW